MTGLEKMMSQILEEANASANSKRAEAAAEADRIKAAAEAEADAKAAEIAQKSAADLAGYQERVKSSADLRRRTALLAAKQELISETIQKAYDTFCAKDDAEYFDTLKKMVEKFAAPQKGEIALNAQDLAKLPAGFEKEVNALAQKKGGELVLSKAPASVEKGFILSYGGIEENCSFKAMFDAKKDECQDLVQKILFS